MKTPLELVQAALTASSTHDRSTWLALWEEDARIEDPVGGSGPGPQRDGYNGIEQIAGFWDNSIAKNREMRYDIERCYACGDEVAMVIHFHIDKGDSSMDLEVINIYKRSPNGKLASLRSFWGDRKAA